METGQLDSKIIANLKEKTVALMNAVDSGNLKESVDLINLLNKTRQEVFYQEVGMLTRTLHDSIRSYGLDLGAKLNGGEGAVENASQSLSYVINITEKNSHETMDKVDRLINDCSGIKEQNSQIIKALELVAQHETVQNNHSSDIEEAFKAYDANNEKLQNMESELMDIIVSQGIQDISGQLIRKVIDLLEDVESRLVSLVSMAANIDDLSPLNDEVEDEKESPIADFVEDQTGPQHNKENKDAVHCQEDVDDLLSSLGF